MKLLRLKITDPAGFRSLQAGFEFKFRTNWHLQDEQGFAPFVCAGPNGSGKSNLLEALAAIFFQLEVQRLRRSFLPASFVYDEDANPEGFKVGDGKPNAFELDYLIKVPGEYVKPGGPELAFVRVTKELGQHIKTFWANQTEFDAQSMEFVTGAILGILLPEFVLGYSSGENEILSLPFFKMRFVQFDEYWQSLTQQLSYSGRPESRLVYLDPGFSQAILLCNLLFQKEDAPNPFRADVKIQALKEFRIIIRRSIDLDYYDVFKFDADGSAEFREASEIASRHPALIAVDEEGIVNQKYRCRLINLLQGTEASQNGDGIINRLIRCATCHFVDETTDTLYLDYFVNEATREAFRDNFDFEINNSPIGLFQAFQVLLTLNLYTVSDELKADLYQSESLYVSETVPVLASDQRIMRFKNVLLTKTDVAEPVLLKSLSDGEHQLLHSLGLCLLFKNTESLFLLDEPETHFNPDWRANFISRLHQNLNGSDGQEMLITTHTPFLISDSKPEKVLVFAKDKNGGKVSISHPDYNTLGASINKIMMSKVFDKRETIGGHAHTLLEGLRARFEKGDEDKEALITEIDQQLGDSVEKVLLINAILGGDQLGDGGAQS